MEIIGTNQEQKDKKNKKLMFLITIAIVILLIVSIILYITIDSLKKQQFKFYIDEVAVKSTNELIIEENNITYISLEEIAPLIGYKYYNGGYKQYSEDTTKCYLESENEVCTFEEDSTTIYKTPIDIIDYEYFKIELPIKSINNKLYISKEGLSIACNLKFYKDEKNNSLKIYTLEYYADYFMKNESKCAVADNFKNQKALLYDLMIVQNIDNNQTTYNEKDIRYGIYTIDGKEIVGTKYTKIDFIESTKEFIVRTTENKVGIITADGETKVKPQYDTLKQIDKDLNLYLATNDNKKGVIEKNGKILIYLEYDEIGIDATKFDNNNITNSYLLFNNAIPVKQNGKWGLFDKKGNIILPIEYESLGCTNNKSTSNSIIIIPEINGIVVSKTYESQDKKKTTLYGIVNHLGRELIPTSLETVYSVTNNGRDEYTMTHNGKEYNVIDYINEWVDLKTLNNENTTNTTNTKNITNNTNTTDTNTNVTNNITNTTNQNVIKQNNI